MRVLVADDHSIVRMGMRLMLESAYADITIDEAQNGNEIAEHSKRHSYDLLILDFQMPDTDTFGIISYLLACRSDSRILIFTMAPEKVFADKLFKAGVKGFLSKEAGNAEVLKAVAVVLSNEQYASDEYLSRATHKKSSAANPFTTLSNKEMDVVNYLVQGKTTKEISNLLHLQLSTISTHKARIYGKLNIDNIAELIELANEYQRQ